MRTGAILGRPNVGKSTLFNRLTRTRRALVLDEPGVTRDRLDGITKLGDIPFRLIDTAGMDPGSGTVLESRLMAQSLAGLDEADFGLLVIDGREGVTATDAELAKRLRPMGKPLIVLVNKAEGRAGLAGLPEAWTLGLGEPIAISAEHGDGLPDLIDRLRPLLRETEAEAAKSDAELDQDGPAEDTAVDENLRFIRLAVVGRPNVGKSTLVNRLTESDRLLTGPEPGLTRDAVTIAWEYEGRRIELVDTAGLRRKARIDLAVEKLSAGATVRAIREAHAVLLLVDALAPLEQQDLTIANIAIDEGRALLLAANKWDLVDDPQERLLDLRERLELKLAQVKGLISVPISAETGRGLDKIFPAVVQATVRWRKRISTGRLNRWLKTALEKHEPPLVHGRRLKLRYMTQVTSRPPTFALFSSAPESALPDSYLRYLAAGLRESFDLDGVPLRFVVRHGDNPFDPD